MTVVSNQQPRIPFLGKFLILLVFLGLLALLMAIVGTGGGGTSPQDPKEGGGDWPNCTQEQAINEGLNVSISIVQAWFNPGGVFAGQNPSAVLNSASRKQNMFNAFGEFSDDYFVADQHRVTAHQVYRERMEGICYPNVTSSELSFLRSIWGN